MATKFYTEEMFRFLSDNINGKSYKNLTELFNKKFNLNKSIYAVQTLCSKGLKLKNNGGERFYYSEEMLLFLRKNVSGCPLEKLTELFNNTFSTQKTKKEIYAICGRYKFHNGCQNKLFYTEERLQFLKSIVPGRSWEEIALLFNAKFGVNIKYRSLQRACVARGILTGRVGHRYHKERSPLGTERIDKDGYLFIKVKHPNKWTPKHILLWEQKNGPVPDGYCIIFADGDKTNFNESNLIKVSRKEHFHLNRRKLRFSDPEYTKAGLNIVKLFLKAEERQKELNNEESEKENQPEEA